MSDNVCPICKSCGFSFNNHKTNVVACCTVENKMYIIKYLYLKTYQ